MHKRNYICCLGFIFSNCILISPHVLGETCMPTDQMSPGTHNKSITQQKINIGQGLNITGTVLSAKDCSAIENARVEHWQTNSKGKYVDGLRAYLLSDANGKFEFETEWPGAPVPHIHFIIFGEGHKKLVTQWVGSEKVEVINLELILEPLQK
jgi:protocatechuate 3,4-dioxygenase beta subunit